jgi:ABC-2 type transport system permease protein
VRWLLLKDLRILRRSPLLVTLLIVYPIVLALLIGFALSRGPGKPDIAVYNGIPRGERTFDVGGDRLNANEYLPAFERAVRLHYVDSREAAIKMVEDGEVLGAIILPGDLAAQLSTGRTQPTLEIAYNGEDAAKQAYVESTIESKLAAANAALSKRYQGITINYINLLLDGGDLSLLGREIPILGLRNSERILRGAMATLDARPGTRAALEQVANFAKLAIDNLDLSTDVLRSVGTPIRAKTTIVGGKKTPLDAYAIAISVTISLMFLTLLLASGLLALEREENAFSRLVRGLVSKLGLLLEKIGLAALCAFAVTLAMMLGIGAFFVDLDFARFPLWLVALAGGGIAFAAMGAALGGVAREVRAASLFAIMLSLPITFLALVPSGAVSAGLYDVVSVVSAAFPFKPTLRALDTALNDNGQSFVVPIAHLVALAVAYTALARLALRRFA